MSNYFSKNQIDLLAKAKSEKKYIHLKNENESLKKVMNVKSLNKLISMHNCWDNKNFALVLNKNTIPFTAFFTKGDTLGFAKTAPDPIKVENYLRRGASLVLNDLIYFSNEIEKLASDLQSITNGRCQANLYFSMQSHQAFAPHFDTHDVFALHCEGEKIWNIYENFEKDPINHPIYKQELNDKTEKPGKIIDQVLLKPGDLLYLPRGQFHDALASKNGAMHIAFGITYLKPIDIFQYYYNQLIINDFFRSDIRQINSTDDIKNIHAEITSQLNKIFNNEKLYEHSLNYFKQWPYKLTGYDIEKIINDGVQYEIVKNITITEEEKKIFIVNEKHKVPVPEKFFQIIKFVFEKRIVSYKSIKSEFNNISDDIINEFIDAMKNMKIFI